MRCEKIKKNSKQCQAYAFSDGSGMCLFHSTTEKAREARKVKLFTKEQMIRILQKQIRKLEKETEDPISVSGEIRRNIQMIQELKGEKPSPQEEEKEPEGESIETKLKRWKKNTQ